MVSLEEEKKSEEEEEIVEEEFEDPKILGERLGISNERRIELILLAKDVADRIAEGGDANRTVEKLCEKEGFRKAEVIAGYEFDRCRIQPEITEKEIYLSKDLDETEKEEIAEIVFEGGRMSDRIRKLCEKKGYRPEAVFTGIYLHECLHNPATKMSIFEALIEELKQRLKPPHAA